MPDTVSHMENEALRDCMSLTELRFSAKLESVADSVCVGCSSLRTVVIPEGPKYILQNSFRGCSSLQEAYIPDSVVEIAGNAFADTPLFRMTAGHYIVGRFLIRADGYSPIPVGVHRIGPRAFERGGLRAAIIPDGVISIGDNAFANCGVLTDVVIPKSVTEIGVDAFACTPWMARRTEPYTIAGANILLHANIMQQVVSLPVGVRCIGPTAFSQLPIRKVTLPEGVVHLQHGAFSYCEQLEEIELPTTIRRIDGYIFHGCTALKRIKLNEGLPKIGHAMFSSCTSLKTLRLPATVTEIENEAFYHAGIERIILPDSVTRIGQSAFSHCEHLTDIAIPASVTEISENAFTECPKFRLHAEEGSYAERYAKQHHMLMTLVPLDMDALLAAEQAAEAAAQPVVTEQPVAPVAEDAPAFLYRQETAQKPEQQITVPERTAAQPTPNDIFLNAAAEPIPKRAKKPVSQALEPQPEQTADEPEQTAEPVKPAEPAAPKKAAQKKADQPKKAAPEQKQPETDPEPVIPAPIESEAADAEPAEPEAVAAAPESVKPESVADEPVQKPEPVWTEPEHPVSFDAEEELNYAQRVKRELEEARKKSILGDPRIKLPPIEEEPAPQPEKPKKKRKKRELSPEELEQKLRAKETPEETKARHRAALLDDLPDLPDLPEEREMKRREKESPEQAKARRRAALLDDLPDVDEMPHRRDAAPPEEDIEPDIPKLDANTDGKLSDPEAAAEDPFADIHWNNDQTTFTIRL